MPLTLGEHRRAEEEPKQEERAWCSPSTGR